MSVEGYSLGGKRALVTGVEGETGQVAALALAEAGADVLLTGRTGVESDLLAAVKGMGRKAWSFPARLDDSRAVEAMVREAIVAAGGIDVLVNAPDRSLSKPFVETTDAEWSELLRDNLSALVVPTRAVARHMLDHGGGAIVNIFSMLAARGMPDAAAYCAVKGAALQLTKALALEWARSGIRVNAIGTGWFSDSATEPDEEMSSPLLRYLPLRRLGEPQELGALVVLLSSDALQYMTGQCVFVDGGALAHA